MVLLEPPSRSPPNLLQSPPKLTFFHADFGKEFPSRNLWRGPSQNCPSPSSALYPFLYRTEHFSRGGKGRKYAEKRGGRGVARKGGKKEKGTREKGSGNHYINNSLSGAAETQFLDIFWTMFAYWSMLLFGDPVQCSPVTKTLDPIPHISTQGEGNSTYQVLLLILGPPSAYRTR